MFLCSLKIISLCVSLLFKNHKFIQLYKNDPVNLTWFQRVHNMRILDDKRWGDAMRKCHRQHSTQTRIAKRGHKLNIYSSHHQIHYLYIYIYIYTYIHCVFFLQVFKVFKNVFQVYFTLHYITLRLIYLYNTF